MTTYRATSVASILLFLSSLSGVAQADLINVVGSWDFTISGQGFPPGTSFSGSAMFSYDDSVLTGIGLETISPIPLTFLSLTPSTIGVTAFDTTNSSAFVSFVNGIPDQTFVGGALNGPTGVSSFTDDWAVGSGVLGPALSTAASPGIIALPNTSFTHTPAAVPEPSSALLVLMFGGFFISRRQRRNALR